MTHDDAAAAGATDGLPPSRWRQHAGEHRYLERFSRLIDAGEDIDGEARLADVLAPREARILDVGAGMGRVAAGLHARGHRVVALEPEEDLVAECRRRYPDVTVLQRDVLEVTSSLLAEVGLPEAYDVVVAVGNVMICLAEDTEQQALRVLAGLLAPEGRLLVGFHTHSGPSGSRSYPAEEFIRDAAAAGLAVEHRFGSYQLGPQSDEYAVIVLKRPVDQP